MEKSIADLKEAFAGESQANRKYLAFAEKADKEGYPQVARLFRAAAHAETVHALNHLRALKGIGSTAENLKEAIAGESAEFQKMYPRMIADSKAEGHKEAERTFTFANEVEQVHAPIRRPWKPWKKKNWWIYTSARSAAIPRKARRRTPARSARRRKRCSPASTKNPRSRGAQRRTYSDCQKFSSFPLSLPRGERVR